MLAIQMHLTALNAKSEPEAELVAEFDRRFSGEPPNAIEWAFVAWRDESRFFPSVADIRRLLKLWRRAERERLELESRLSERFLLEERRKQGLVPDFKEVLAELRRIAEEVRPECMEKEEQFQKKLMRHALSAVPTLALSEEEIQKRRQKERAEIQHYHELEGQQDGSY
jgi:hypothetical protein